MASSNTNRKERTMYKKSYLKWAGGKNKMLGNLLPILNKHRRDILVEPFIGAGNVALNFDCERYILNDLNKDLIVSHKEVIEFPMEYIADCQSLFNTGYEDYYQFRDIFNQEVPEKRYALFQYLNKHGFNGLCRYNKKGEFNVPIGTVKVKGNNVPVEQVCQFSGHFLGKNVELLNLEFQQIFNIAEEMDTKCLIYCDPPYIPMGESDINYTGEGFSYEDQKKLKELALQSKHTVVISNHWNDITRDLYKDTAEVHEFDVQRTISCKGKDRIKVKECVVVYE